MDDEKHHDNYIKDLTLDCKLKGTQHKIFAPGAEYWNLNPLICSTLDLMCLAYFGFFRYFKTTWATQNKKDSCRNVFFLSLCAGQAIVFILAIFNISSVFYADLIRPVIVFDLFSQLRFSSIEFLRDVRSSISILFSIFAWIFFFALAGFYLFRNSFEGLTYFKNLQQSFMSMLTAMTTANYPDVMLPQYYNNFFVVFFFIIYLLFGIFFLLSVLIANVFNKYKTRLEERISRDENMRRDQIEQAYKKFENLHVGYLSAEEFKQFFEFVFDVRLQSKAGRIQYRKVLNRLGLTE